MLHDNVRKSKVSRIKGPPFTTHFLPASRMVLSMTVNSLEDFTKYLLHKNVLSRDYTSKLDKGEGNSRDASIRRLWELSELGANDFADEVAHFFALPRINLPELLDASSVVRGFSPRFLREMMVLPYQTT